MEIEKWEERKSKEYQGNRPTRTYWLISSSKRWDNYDCWFGPLDEWYYWRSLAWTSDKAKGTHFREEITKYNSDISNLICLGYIQGKWLGESWADVSGREEEKSAEKEARSHSAEVKCDSDTMVRGGRERTIRKLQAGHHSHQKD